MKKLWAISALLLLFATGCSANASDGPRPTDGEGLYNLSCLNCHGENLEGAAGPPVLNMSSKYSEEELLKLINEGVGMMPGKLLSEEEAQIVTKWLMEK
ncbi:MAG: cytochrome c [Neobacillus sp.]